MLVLQQKALRHDAGGSLKVKHRRIGDESDFPPRISHPSTIIKVGQMLSGKLPVVMLFGARSDLGDAFNARLNACGQNTVNVSRNPSGVRLPPGAITVHPELLARNRVGARFNVVGIVSVCPIWELPGYADFLSNSPCREAPWVVLSSTSAVTKQESAERASQAIVSKLCAGEDGVGQMRSEASGWTIIIPPTLIYGGRRNRNINKHIKRNTYI